MVRILNNADGHRCPKAQCPCLLLEQVNRAKNERRFYYLAWQSSLFDEGAIMRSYERQEGQRRTLTPHPYPSLDTAWPWLRTMIRRRLHHRMLW